MGQIFLSRESHSHVFHREKGSHAMRIWQQNPRGVLGQERQPGHGCPPSASAAHAPTSGKEMGSTFISSELTARPARLVHWLLLKVEISQPQDSPPSKPGLSSLRPVPVPWYPDFRVRLQKAPNFTQVRPRAPPSFSHRPRVPCCVPWGIPWNLQSAQPCGSPCRWPGLFPP